MNYWTRNWLGERSTRLGLVGIVGSLAALVISFCLDLEQHGNLAGVMQNVGGAVLAAGLAAVFYREKPKC